MAAAVANTRAPDFFAMMTEDTPANDPIASVAEAIAGMHAPEEPVTADHSTMESVAEATTDSVMASAAEASIHSAASDDVTPVPVVEPAPVVEVSSKKWYVVKVASGREESIKNAIVRKIKIEGLEKHFGQIVIPVERITELKKEVKTVNGQKVTKEKRVVKEKKKYPGYLMAEVEFTDQILYVFRETNGVGDFVGATGPLKPPPPMSDREVAIMLGTELSSKDDEKLAGKKPKIKVKIDFEKGDKVRLRDGAFAGTEGEVLEITEAKDDETPKITVEVQFWGRPVKIDNLEYWQVDKV
jgi:transcription termination/antitermination protein NusG